MVEALLTEGTISRARWTGKFNEALGTEGNAPSIAFRPPTGDLRDERRSGRPAHNRAGKFPHHSPVAGGAHHLDLLASTSFSGCRKRSGSDCERRRRDAGDCPDEADHLASDCGRDHDLWPAGRGKPPMARAQSQLGFPGDVADRRWQLLVAVVELAADPRRHPIDPGSLD